MVECELLKGQALNQLIFVLIDTWWNVNFRLSDLQPGSAPGFNRYMVECELFIGPPPFYVRKSFNRYMVECESYRSCSDFGKRRSFNRYMVECEYSSADVILFL